MSPWFKRAVRSPLLHFFAAGAVIYALVPEARPVIVVSDPGQIDEEILIQEAMALGLLDDPVVSEWLARVGQFIGDQDCEDAEQAIALARELNLDRKDVVVRRYLVQMMRLAMAAESDRQLPSEVELEAHLREHADRFRAPEELRLTQVFVSSRRGNEMRARAEAVGRQLASNGAAVAQELSDPFSRPNELTASLAKIRETFGVGFEEALDEGLIGSWQGPIPSAHGLHWVRTEERIPARLPEVSEIRGQLLHHYRRVHREEHMRRRLAGLRTRYEIVSEPDEG